MKEFKAGIKVRWVWEEGVGYECGVNGPLRGKDKWGIWGGWGYLGKVIFELFDVKWGGFWAF
jgi:hypothetical protein